jgi:hypothetical protein
VPKKPSRPSVQKQKAMRTLPLSKDQAKHVKGGARDIFAKLGDIKGESLDTVR